MELVQEHFEYRQREINKYQQSMHEWVTANDHTIDDYQPPAQLPRVPTERNLDKEAESDAPICASIAQWAFLADGTPVILVPGLRKRSEAEVRAFNENLSITKAKEY